MGLLRFGNPLTVSGNEITDATRALGIDGDGLQNDGSFGIWEQTTNGVPNSAGFATWTLSRFAAPTADLTHSLFGTTGKFTVATAGDSFAGIGGDTGAMRCGMVAGQTYTFSVWVYIPSTNPGSGTWFLNIFDNDGTGYAKTSVTITERDQLVRKTVTRTLRAGATEAFVRVENNGGVVGDVVYIEAPQVEQKPIATPYKKTTGVAATRPAARLQAPASLLDETQGGIMLRLAMGYDASAALTQNNVFFEWQDSANERLVLDYIRAPTQTWRIAREHSGTFQSVVSAAQTFHAGDEVTVIACWDAGNVKISVNGGPFVSAAAALIPTLAATMFDIGSAGGGALVCDSRVKWAATFEGTLTDADAATIAAFASDPSPLDFPDTANVTAVFKFDDATYITYDPNASTSTPTPRYTAAGGWRFILGDQAGRPIANLTTISKDRSLAYRLLRPASATLKVPSDHELVATAHTDGFPLVDAMRRTLRAYRRERQTDGSYLWTCRFAGAVWQVEDVADGDTAWTTISAFDPLQRLAHRFTGTDPTPRALQDGGQIAKGLIDDANALGATGIATSGYGNVYDVTPARVVQYDRRAVGDALTELASAYNGFDFVLRPVIQSPGQEDGTLCAYSVYAHYGSFKPDVVFGWDMPPHNLKSVDRQVDGEELANVVTAIGTPQDQTVALTSTQSAPGSIADFGRYESVDTLGDVVDQAYLDAQAQSEVQVAQSPRSIVQATPSPTDVTTLGQRGRVPRPFLDFDLGDTVTVQASKRLRGGFVEQQRVYGFTLTVDPNGVEYVSSIVTSSDG
jgi:hypothetical protein